MSFTINTDCSSHNATMTLTEEPLALLFPAARYAAGAAGPAAFPASGAPVTLSG